MKTPMRAFVIRVPQDRGVTTPDLERHLRDLLGAYSWGDGSAFNPARPFQRAEFTFQGRRISINRLPAWDKGRPEPNVTYRQPKGE